MKNAVGYMISGKGVVTVSVNGKTYNIDKDHANYQTIIANLRSNNYEGLDDLLNVSNAITKHTDGKLCVKNGFIYNGDYIVDNSLTRRILDFIQGDFPIDPMLKFLENVLENPSARAIGELYTFLEVNTLPLTSDGCFLAYKRVDSDYKDLYTHTINNHVGQVIKMDRQLVVDDKTQTCAYGYHACSLGYLSEFHSGEGHVMILKINPRDVVSIPIDYNNSKLRCCEYEVVGEYGVDHTKPIPDKFDKPLYAEDGNEFKEDERCLNCDELSDDCKCSDDRHCDDDDCGGDPDCDNCANPCGTGDTNDSVEPIGEPVCVDDLPKVKNYHNKRDKFGRFKSAKRKR